MYGMLHSRRAKLSLLAGIAAFVCPLGFAQLMPPSGSTSYAAKVLTATGQVSVLKDSQPWALSIGDGVQVKDFILTGPDGHAVFQVSDGSTFEVFPNSRVMFRNNPPSWKDLLDVLVGRVRVHIEHWGNVPNPNRIITPTAVISVRGTTFDVSVDDDDETTLVEVEEGTVEVQHALLPRGSPKTLQTGESLRVYRNEPLQAHLVDKGTVARQILRSMVDAVSTIAIQSRTGVGGIGTTTGSGDGQKAPPPPPTTTAPPPPPPSH